MFCFFFSSRRRHTRCSRDWSSDVCSSDLETRCARHRAPDWSRSERLEQLNRVAGGILDENLLSPVACDDWVAKPRAGVFQLVDGRFQIFDFDLDTVPSAWRRNLTVWHRLSSAAGARSIE